MIGFELGGVEIDHCVSCLGTWLDTGEIEWIAELAGVEAGPLSKALADARAGARGSRRCPRCTGRLRTAELNAGDSGSEQIEIDHCPRRCGLWLDQGELAQLVHMYNEGEGEGGAIADFFRDLYRSEFDGDKSAGLIEEISP